VDGSYRTGHQLRDGGVFSSPKRVVKVPVVIVGGGMAGLCAAWRLEKRGLKDFVILELEKQAGGNSRSGQNEASAYPWAAHYVPVPDKNSHLVREMMEEFGVLRNGEWDERHLCHSPQERLYLHGRWQEGIEPETGEQGRRFQATMEQFAASGEFRIPVATGAMKNAALDRLTMQQWMATNGFNSEYLNWQIDYACRDDFGAKASATSAWAGIHYFAARFEKQEKGPLTWPEGNGWITKRLLAKLAQYVRLDSFVHRIQGQKVFAGDTEYHADAVIFAVPTFLAPRIIEGAPPAKGFVYSAWLTANLTLDRWPNERGIPVAWDNVIYKSPALGYVVATHQSLRTRIDKTVWTFYWPIEDRRLLLEKDWAYWSNAVLSDLEYAHKDIRECVTRIDIMRMGHAMIRPSPGFLFSKDRERWTNPGGRIFYANSDLSGISLFEEAQYRGVTAAEKTLRLIG